MNGLISWTVERYVHSELTWLKYGALSLGGTSLDAFKRRAGFTSYATVLDLAGEPELVGLAKLRSG